MELGSVSFRTQKFLIKFKCQLDGMLNSMIQTMETYKLMKRVLIALLAVTLAASTQIYKMQASSDSDSSQLTNQFVLQLQFACRKNVAFSSCMGNIRWNNELVKSIEPTDHHVHTVAYYVYVKEGENKLQIEGDGTADSYGLTVDNVKLNRRGNCTNFVENGDFQNPNVKRKWGNFKNIQGWEGKGIEIGWGKIYNNEWNSQICQLDGKGNFEISQRWNFDSDYKLVEQSTLSSNKPDGKSLSFKLELDYAARAKGVKNTETSSGKVYWNNKVIGTLAPNDYQVHHASFQVQMEAGVNSLQLEGVSKSDTYGLNIDNVKLTSSSTNQNLIQNGQFEKPNTGRGWKLFKGGLPHWKAQNAELGHCHYIYNANWPISSGQCIELDSTSNQKYTQTVQISDEKFQQMLLKSQS